MSNRYDIVILGAGNAGFGVSQVAQAAGKSIAFVESDEFGGTCPNRACTPKKVLVAAANAMHEIERAATHGIEVGPARLDWGKLIDWQDGHHSAFPYIRLRHEQFFLLMAGPNSGWIASIACPKTQASLRLNRSPSMISEISIRPHSLEVMV